MGNIKSKFMKEGEFLQAASKFQNVKYDTDRHCVQLLEKKTQEEFYFKQIDIKDTLEKAKIEWLCNQKKDFNCDNILKIRMFAFEKQQQNYNSVYKGYLLFDKPLKDLRTEAITRHGSKIGFSDTELLIIIEGVVRALKWLKSINHHHGAICTGNILISHSGTIYLSDPWLNPEINSYTRSKNRIYFSPERLKSQKFLQDWFSSDLFSLGVCILQLIFMSSMEDVYTRSNTIDFHLLSFRTFKIKNYKLRRFVEGLLHPMEYKRVIIANQIDSQVKIVTVTLKSNSEFINIKHQQSNSNKFINNKKKFGMLNSQHQKCSFTNLKQRNISSNTFSRSRNDQFPLFSSATKQVANFKKKKPLIQSSGKQNIFVSTITYSTKSNRKRFNPNVNSSTPVKLYSTINQKLNFSELSHNYSSSRISKLGSSQYSNHKQQQSCVSGFNKCRTQRNEQLRSNLFTSQFQHCLTEVEEKVQRHMISLNRKQNASKKLNRTISAQYLSPSPHPSLVCKQPRKFNHQLQTQQTSKIQKAGQLQILVESKYMFQMRENQPQQHTEIPINFMQEALFQPIKIVQQNQQKLIQTSSTNIEQALCEFNNSKTHTFDTVLYKIQQPCVISELQKQQSQPLTKSKLKKLSFLKSHIVEQQMTPKRTKQNNPKNSTIKEESESSVSLATANSKQFVIEDTVGGRYEGYKYDGYRNGRGRLYYQQGGYYDGQWKDDCMHGLGKLYYDNNGQLAYEGEFFANQFHGKGKVFNDQVQIITGSFDYKDFNKVGQSWLSYEGYFQCDMRNGIGRLRLSNGEIFEGEFKDDRVQGEGRFFTLDGDLIIGIWDNSLYIGQSKK